VESKGITTELVRQLTPADPSAARDCVLIARGCRGDAGVKPELYRIIRESPVPGIRNAAVNAFVPSAARPTSGTGSDRDIGSV